MQFKLTLRMTLCNYMVYGNITYAVPFILYYFINCETNIRKLLILVNGGRGIQT